MDAQEACKQVSSRAEEIAAEGQKISDGIKAFFPVLQVFNPKNYAAANDARQEIKNITKLDMSNEDVYKLGSSCSALATTVQANTIDTTACSKPEIYEAWVKILDSPTCKANPSLCPANPATFSKVTQQNISNGHLTCTMNGLMDFAKTQTATIDTAATIEAAQKAINIAANKSSQSSCNYVNSDMSSAKYIELLNKCAVTTSTEQSNMIKGCVNMYNVSQLNNSDQMNQCLIDNKILSAESQDNKITQKSSSILSQIAEGISPMACASSCSVCLIFCLICAYLFMS